MILMDPGPSSLLAAAVDGPSYQPQLYLLCLGPVGLHPTREGTAGAGVPPGLPSSSSGEQLVFAAL